MSELRKQIKNKLHMWSGEAEPIDSAVDAIVDVVIQAMPKDAEDVGEYGNPQETGEMMGWDKYRSEVMTILESAKSGGTQ